MTTNSDDASLHSQTASSDKSDIRESDRAKKRQRSKEDGRVQKSRAVGQNRKAIRAGTREKVKEIEAGIAYALIEWGSYNPDFVTSGTAGEKELYDFLQQLEKVSTFAKTSADTIARFLSGQRKSSKLNILTTIQYKLPYLLQDDVIFLTDATSLKNALNQPFQVPLLHRTTTSQSSLAPNTNFGIQELLEHVAEDEEASISVYDYSISDPTGRTYQTTVHELLSCFPSENAHRTALNFLDIENRTNIQFCPPPIILQDITTKLGALGRHDKGKTGSEWKAELRKEFFLTSMKNAISSIHVDTGAGVTWVLILTGRKIWYFPRHVNSRTIRWLAQAGSQTPENYEGDWVKVELRPGDLFIMPPSFPHAVFTPDDCLAVGGQFYTAGHLGRTIQGLKFQEDYPDICNEDLDDSVYSTLARILSECGPVTTSFEKAGIVSSLSLFLHLADLTTYDKLSKDDLVAILNSRGVAIPSKPKKNDLLELLKRNGSTRAACTPREKFLKALRELYDKFIADGI